MTALDVAGGSHGITARLEELRVAAAQLRAVGRDVAGLVPVVLECTLSPIVVAAERCAPEAALPLVRARLALSGPNGPLARAVALEALGDAVTLAAVGYQAVDDAVAAGWEGVADAVGFGVGVAGGPVAAAVALPVLTGLGVASVVDPSVRDPRFWGRQLDQVAARHPARVELLAGGIDGLITGLGAGPVTVFPLAVAAARAGVAWPPRTSEDGVRILIAVGAGVLFDDTAEVAVRRQGPPRGVPGPSGVADLVAVQGEILHARTVRVHRVEGPAGGGWIVHVPGTTAWPPVAGENPFDTTSNLTLMAGEVSGTMRAAEEALADAKRRHGRGADDPVMLVGYSQGGMTAAALAANDGFRSRHRVTHVVTVGSPVARMPVPAQVQVLSLEHAEDVVPRLDGRGNPDRATWTTVGREVRGVPAVEGRASAAHGSAVYRETARAVDASGHDSLVSWRRGSARFLGAGPGRRVTETDYELRRVVDRPP